jgi:hypothetical protein
MPTPKKTTTKPPSTNRARKARTPQPPSAPDLIREPDLTASARLRFACDLFLKVTHPEYLAHEVLALVRQGEVELDPVAPGQVGTLILNGFPYTVLGYYIFVERDADYEAGPQDCSFHGRFYERYRDRAATFQDMANAAGEEFDEARRLTQELRAKMTRPAAQPQKRRPPRRKARKA